jgi:hypothetical protein
MSLFSLSHRKTHRTAALLSVALMLSLLFAQWLGYGHAIAHADGLNEATRLESARSSVADHPKTSAACAAFDAATLGAGVHSPALTLATLPAPTWVPVVALPTGHSPAFFGHFSSRAPPLTA